MLELFRWNVFLFLFGKKGKSRQSTEGKNEDAETCCDYKNTSLERICGRVLTKSV